MVVINRGPDISHWRTHGQASSQFSVDLFYSCLVTSVWIFLSNHYPCILLWLILKYIRSYHTYISVYWNRHIGMACVIYCGKNNKQNIRYAR
jgi:hypothetical protein